MASGRLYSCGECPVEGSLGDPLLIKNPDSGLLFLYCHNCGCAWLSPPSAGVLDSIKPPHEYSVRGFVLASPEDVEAARARGWPVKELEPLDDWWRGILSPMLLEG